MESPIEYSMMIKHNIIYFFVDLNPHGWFWFDVSKTIVIIVALFWLFKNVSHIMFCCFKRDSRDSSYPMPPCNPMPFTTVGIRIWIIAMIIDLMLRLVLEFFLYHAIIQYQTSY